MECSLLRQEPVVFVQGMRLAAAIKRYEMERVSQAKAASSIAHNLTAPYPISQTVICFLEQGIGSPFLYVG
jgi:hypothetical protein